MKVKYPFEPKQVGQHQFEQRCGFCGEMLLFEPGDRLHVSIGEAGKLQAIMCTQCYNQSQKNQNKLKS